MADTLEDRIIDFLTAHRGVEFNADQMLDLAPIVATPVVAYRHDLDEADDMTGAGFGSDVTGLASSQPGGTRDLPDRRALVDTLLRLVADGRIEKTQERPVYTYRKL